MMIDAARPLPFRPQGKGLAPRTRGARTAARPADCLFLRARHGRAGPARALRRLCHRDRRDAARAGRSISTPHSPISAAAPILPTEGQQTPWHVSRRSASRSSWCRRRRRPRALPPPPPIRQARPMRDIGPDEAYALAIEMDTLEATPVSSRPIPAIPIRSGSGR